MVLRSPFRSVAVAVALCDRSSGYETVTGLQPAGCSIPLPTSPEGPNHVPLTQISLKSLIFGIIW